MKVIGTDTTVYFDCDDTLIMWNSGGNEKNLVSVTSNGMTQRLKPHRRHIENLKKHKFRGHTVVVWSAGGVDWAKSVVKSLKLDKYVDLVIAKPRWVYDDLSPDEFIPPSNRIYHPDYE